MKNIRLMVNGKERWVKVEPWWTLLDVLRDELQLTGAKKGCDEGVCGACTVLVNGRAVCSCLAFAVEAHNTEIKTIEGLASDKLHPLQECFVKFDGVQCGFCTSGQIMAAAGLLNSNHTPSEEEIREGLSGNVCRCGCYNKIVQSIVEASKIMRGEG